MSLLNPSIELSTDENIIEKFSVSKIYLFVNLIFIELVLAFIVFTIPNNFGSLSSNLPSGLFSDLFSKLKLESIYNVIMSSDIFNFIILYVNIFCIFFMIYFAIYYLWYIPISNIYILTNKRIAVKRGWLSTETVTYSYEKITDIFVAQTFVERFIFRMGTIKIDTAGNGEYDMTLENIDSPELLKASILTIKDEMYKNTSITSGTNMASATSLHLRAEE